METTQMKHTSIATEVASISVEEFVGSKNHIGPATHRYSRYSNTLYSFKDYLDSIDKFSSELNVDLD